jgi:hypothetical protein
MPLPAKPIEGLEAALRAFGCATRLNLLDAFPVLSRIRVLAADPSLQGTWPVDRDLIARADAAMVAAIDDLQRLAGPRYPEAQERLATLAVGLRAEVARCEGKVRDDALVAFIHEQLQCIVREAPPTDGPKVVS